ncbi:hypothetical protein VNN36_09115 [Lactococcus garvieae]|uniref:hypothetical protein n=1 Tax=Lactococcus garvieae TaxID=1363 RepID=UPI0030CB6713
MQKPEGKMSKLNEGEVLTKLTEMLNDSYMQGYQDALNTKLSEQHKLSIPKKIAEIADETWGYGDIDPLDIFGDVRLPDFERWWKSQEHPKDLIVAYLASKALGVELVEVTDE